MYYNKCMSNLSHRNSGQNKPNFFPKTIAIYCNTIAIYLLYIYCWQVNIVIAILLKINNSIEIYLLPTLIYIQAASQGSRLQDCSIIDKIKKQNHLFYAQKREDLHGR